MSAGEVVLPGFNGILRAVAVMNTVVRISSSPNKNETWTEACMQTYFAGRYSSKNGCEYR